MPKVQLISQIEIDLDELLEGVARLETRELERFIEEVLALRARRYASALSQDESRLFQKINHGIPPELRSRYEALNAKLHDETITHEEHQELLALIDQIELADAERLHHLASLARLRNIPLNKLDF
jgi:predicted AAA+ superfamily ATPase